MTARDSDLNSDSLLAAARANAVPILVAFFLLLGLGGAAAYYKLVRLPREAARRAERQRLEAEAEARRKAEKARRKAEEEQRRAEEETRRKTTEAYSLLAAARTFRKAGLLDNACELIEEALSVVPDHAGAKALLGEVQAEIAAKKVEAQREAGYRKWMDRGRELKLAGKLEEAAEAYTKAEEYAPGGSTRAGEAAASCLHDHFKAQAAGARAKGDLERARSLYAKALAKREDAATRRAMEGVTKRLQAARSRKRGDLRSALGLYREAAKYVAGEAERADVSSKVSSLEKELARREGAARRQTAYDSAMRRAKSFEGQSKWENAAAAYEEALRQKPGDPRATRLLAETKRHPGPAKAAKVAKAAKPMTLHLGGGVKMDLVYIEPGVFMMGADEDEGPKHVPLGVEKPVHEVAITRGFYMGKHEVTQAQYERIMGKNPSRFKGADLPVEQVSWNDAMQFCQKLMQRTRRKVRLPTEAEWEHACRAGSTTRYCFGDNADGLGDHAWYKANSGNRTHPVGGKRANAWGLHDMHGNVGEWCFDWYDKGYYARSPRRSPSGPRRGRERVLRRNTWWDHDVIVSSASRFSMPPESFIAMVGFRVVMLPSPGR